jgi:predicted MFS family arabinose efflux permease
LKYSLFVLSALGVGEMLGAVLMGRIVDKIGSKAGVITNLICILIALGFAWLTIIQDTYNWTSFVYALCWGLQDGCVNTHCF